MTGRRGREIPPSVHQKMKAQENPKSRKEQVMTLRAWIKQFEEQFSERELDYRTVQKASLAAQLKDAETGTLHLHNLKYKAKEADDLFIQAIV